MVKPIYGKQQNYNKRYSFVKRRKSPNVRIKISEKLGMLCQGEVQNRLRSKCVNFRNRGHDHIFWQKGKSVNFSDQ